MKCPSYSAAVSYIVVRHYTKHLVNSSRTLKNCINIVNELPVFENYERSKTSSAVAEMGDHLATVEIGRKVWGCCAAFRRGAGSPSNTMSPGPRPTSVPSILIHPSVWPPTIHQRYTQDRQTDRQRSGSIGQPFYKRSPKKRLSKCS